MVKWLLNTKIQIKHIIHRINETSNLLLTHNQHNQQNLNEHSHKHKLKAIVLCGNFPNIQIPKHSKSLGFLLQYGIHRSHIPEVFHRFGLLM